MPPTGRGRVQLRYSSCGRLSSARCARNDESAACAESSWPTSAIRSDAPGNPVAQQARISPGDDRSENSHRGVAAHPQAVGVRLGDGFPHRAVGPVAADGQNGGYPRGAAVAALYQGGGTGGAHIDARLPAVDADARSQRVVPQDVPRGPAREGQQVVRVGDAVGLCGERAVTVVEGPFDQHEALEVEAAPGRPGQAVEPARGEGGVEGVAGFRLDRRLLLFLCLFLLLGAIHPHALPPQQRGQRAADRAAGADAHHRVPARLRRRT